MELGWAFNDRFPILGILHMEKVPRNGVDGGSNDGEEKRDPDPMIDSAPTECGMERLTVDAKVAPMVDEWKAPMVDKVETPSVLEGVHNIVETMARMVDTVGVSPTERCELLVLGEGVTPTIDEVIVPTMSGLMLSAVNETVEPTVEEVDPSISGGVGCPSVGLLGSK